MQSLGYAPSRVR